MATVTQLHGSATALTLNGVNSLASATLSSASADINFTSGPLDALLEVTLDPGTTAGNKQAVIYASDSLDGTNFSDAVNRENLVFVGIMYLPDTNVVRSRSYSLASAFGGTLPPKLRIYIFNDSGAAFNSSGHSAQYAEVRATVA